VSAVPQPWPAREVAVVLPIATARAMFERARRFDFYARWHDPTDEHATIWKVEWDPAAGGSEEEIWRALEILAGGPVTR
jgi:hypothetical protein